MRDSAACVRIGERSERLCGLFARGRVVSSRRPGQLAVRERGMAFNSLVVVTLAAFSAVCVSAGCNSESTCDTCVGTFAEGNNCVWCTDTDSCTSQNDANGDDSRQCEEHYQEQVIEGTTKITTIIHPPMAFPSYKSSCAPSSPVPPSLPSPFVPHSHAHRTPDPPCPTSRATPRLPRPALCHTTQWYL